MWQYQNTDELYHHGVLGMRWGVRKQADHSAKKQAKHEKWVKDNDKRVKTYGKKMVKFSNRARMAVIGVTGYSITKSISQIGAQACRKALAKTGGVPTAKTRATGIAALAAMGLTAGATIGSIYTLHKDNKLADGYDDRQQAAKEAKKRLKRKLS